MRDSDFFEGKTINFQKLLAYGFRPEGEIYSYQRQLLDGQFLFLIQIRKGKVCTELIDAVTKEPYILHLVEESSGEFVGSVRKEYSAVLKEIAALCFDAYEFKQKATKNLLEIVKERYGSEPEYLWEKFPGNAVLRRKDNGKWYGAILTVERKKLGLNEAGQTEILDVRADPEEAALLIDRKRIFAGWHMNKKHWISLLLDGTVDENELLERLEESYFIAGQR